MALETLSSSNDLLNFIIYETFSATSPNLSSSDNGNSNFLFENALRSPENNDCIISAAAMHEEISRISQQPDGEVVVMAGDCRNRKNLGVQGGRKKRRRRPRVCKNKEEAETQRLTHIVVERNRRKQMNEHLSVLRSLMPASYVQRGDQASIVGGAIEFVKELEHLLQSLEAQKFKLSSSHQEEADEGALFTTIPAVAATAALFSQFFTYPQYTWSQVSNKYTSKSKASIADIEVSLIETHANLRILSRRSPKQLTKLAAGLQALHLTILHLNVTTMDSLVLYSISTKVEEGCQLSSVDDIAGAVHHMLRIIEGEAAACASSSSCQ